MHPSFATPPHPRQVAVLGEKLAEKHSEAVVLYNQIFQVRIGGWRARVRGLCEGQ